MAYTPDTQVHPIDIYLRAMAQFAVPSKTDGLSTTERLALPAVQGDLQSAQTTARARFGSTVISLRG